MNLRHKAREEALKILYKISVINNWDFSAFREELAYRDIKDLEKFYDYLEFLVKTVIEYRDFLDKKLSSKVKNWKFERIGIIEKNILRIALAEFYFSSDVPKKVIINEAIELAKKYSTKESARFINGILDAIYKEK